VVGQYRWGRTLTGVRLSLGFGCHWGKAVLFYLLMAYIFGESLAYINENLALYNKLVYT